MVTVSISRTRTGLGHNNTAVLIKKAISAALEAEGIEALCHVDVMLTDNETIREINRENRDIDRATDVLSFPMNELKAGEFDESLCEVDMDTGEILLGDMVISIPRCEEQGIEFGHGYEREVSYLAVHSTLHLLGYDHMDEGEEKRLMRSREDIIMEKLGITR